MMKKAIPFCLSAALLTSPLSLHAKTIVDIMDITTHFSVVSIAPSVRLSNSFVYDQAFIDIPESTSEVALGFTNGGGTFGALSSQRARGYMRQRLVFDVWDASYQRIHNPFYRNYMTHTPVIMPFTGPQASVWTEAGLAPATTERVVIKTRPTIEWSTADGYVKTAPQTGNHTVGALASMTRASENTNVIQTNLLRTVAWIAEKGTSISPPRILKCIPNAETAKPDCTDTALDLSLFSEIQSVMFRPRSNVVYVTAVDAATGTSELYFIRVDASTGLPSSPILSKVVFSDGLDHQLSWVFSAPAETDVFYAASSWAVYEVVELDSSNPGTATIRDIELKGLSVGAFTTEPQIFTTPVVWRERSETRLKTNYWETDRDLIVALGQGNTASMCRGTYASSAWHCWPGETLGADITAISAPTSFNWEWNVQGAQVRPTVDFVFGFGTPVPGYDTTLLGCSMLLPGAQDEVIVARCEAAAEESETVTALTRL